MSFHQLARRYMSRQRGRTAMLSIIFMVAILIGLIGTMILRSFEQSLLTLGEQSNAKISVSTFGANNLIEQELIDTLSALSNINWVNRVNEVVATVADIEIGIGENEEIDDASIRIQGFDDLTMDGLFSENMARLTLGYLALEDGEIIIHETLATMNDLELGDTLTFYHAGMTVAGTIAGIYMYEDSGIRNEAHTPSAFRFENLIFATPTFVNQLQQEAGFLEVNFYITDPTIIEDTRYEFENELSDTTFGVQVSDALFRRMAQPLSQTASLTTIVLGITGIGVIVVVSLLLIIWSRERQKETALLLSIGRTKVSIISQRLLEVLVIYISTFVFTIPLVFIAAPSIATFYQGVVGLNDMEDFILEVGTVGVTNVFLLGLLALIVVIILSCTSVMRQSPKSIFSRND